MLSTRVFWYLLLSSLAALPGGRLLAQRKDDTLKEARVNGQRLISGDAKINEFAPGQKIKTIDSATLSKYQLRSMADLLSRQVPVFIKSYGFNGLATVSFRGASSAQSTVLWNGVPIQNAALGIADVAALPVLFMSRVNIIYGGSAALWGSGNVGGALSLEQDAPVFGTGKTSLSVSGGGGSFGQYMGGFKSSVSLKRWYLSLDAFGQQARNDFSYTDAGGVTLKMPNDRLVSGAAMARAAYKVDEHDILSLSGWAQRYDRESPPALFESFSDKKQTDASLRLLADWTHKAATSSWYARSSFIKDDSRYRDDTALIDSRGSVYQYYQEIGWRKRLGGHGRLLLFTPIQLSWFVPESTSTRHEQDKLAIAGAYDIKLLNDKLNLAVNAREEKINDQLEFLPGADASYAITRWLSARVNAQRTYRAPTLNELYYFPGGNPDLKPEQGWNEDAGYTVSLKAGRFSIYHDLSVYNRDIHDWIIWLGGAIWTPHNIAEVHSRGVETDNSVDYAIGGWRFHAGLSTAYSIATTVASYIANDGSIDRQIPYTPRYNARVYAGFTYGHCSVDYDHAYTGYRFITTDESEYLVPYQTGNLRLAYDMTIGTHTLQISAQCDNIWNQRYEVISGRPMPGTNWLAGIRFNIL